MRRLVRFGVVRDGEFDAWVRGSIFVRFVHECWRIKASRCLVNLGCRIACGFVAIIFDTLTSRFRDSS